MQWFYLNVLVDHSQPGWKELNYPDLMDVRYPGIANTNLIFFVICTFSIVPLVYSKFIRDGFKKKYHGLDIGFKESFRIGFSPGAFTACF